MTASDNNVLVKQLIEFGLSEKEAKIYLALLELEVATVNEAAETADINRSSAYVVMEALKKKGLVSTSEDKKIQTYSAVSPEMLLREAKDRVIKTSEIENKISDIIPELKALHKDTKEKPLVRVYEGKEGLIASFEDTLNNREKVLRAYSSTEKIFEVLSDYLPKYVQRRIKLGIKMYGIHPDDKIARRIIEVSPKFDEPILIPPTKYKPTADMAIYDNKTAYMSTKGGFAITIESKEMANVMKSIFDLAFEEAKRLNKNISKRKK